MTPALYLVADNPAVAHRDRRDRALARAIMFLRTARVDLRERIPHLPAEAVPRAKEVEIEIGAAIALLEGVIADEREP